MVRLGGRAGAAREMANAQVPEREGIENKAAEDAHRGVVTTIEAVASPRRRS